MKRAEGGKGTHAVMKPPRGGAIPIKEGAGEFGRKGAGIMKHLGTMNDY